MIKFQKNWWKGGEEKHWKANNPNECKGILKDLILELDCEGAKENGCCILVEAPWEDYSNILFCSWKKVPTGDTNTEPNYAQITLTPFQKENSVS
ncbi:hypothetical protein OVS_03470 [Mycoplasma ovis str. Michigan]|uniref:Uncharacterized protein n=2 Tax=Mycoplasma ovis TaxID=171632 RepID=A0ABN4BRC6_9MOLU|nr:hypothetical protein OVS_03470 [Mycoplasma ovis str. Michigan]